MKYEIQNKLNELILKRLIIIKLMKYKLNEIN